MVSCDDYDYLEIASLYQLEVTLHTQGDAQYTGRIVNLYVSKDKKEWLTLRLSNPSGKTELALETKQLTAMVAISDNPHFSRIDF